MSNLALGTVQFGLNYGVANKTGQPNQREIADILSLAAKFGINLLDTAQVYGTSERILGALDTSNFNIVTKLGQINGDPSLDVRTSLLGSLERLNRDNIYGLLLHDSDQILGEKEFGARIVDTMLLLKDEGLVEKIGVSVYTPHELELILEIFTPDIVQFPCSAIDGRWLQSGLLAEMKILGVERHVRSVFLQGLLALKPEFLPTWASSFSNTIRMWHDWCAEINMTSIEAALCFATNNADFDKTIVGVERSSQLKDLLLWSTDKKIVVPEYLLTCHEGLLDVRKWKN